MIVAHNATVLYALITEQLVPSASGGLPNMMSTVNLDLYMRNRDVNLVVNCSVMLFQVMMEVLSCSDC